MRSSCWSSRSICAFDCSICDARIRACVLSRCAMAWLYSCCCFVRSPNHLSRSSRISRSSNRAMTAPCVTRSPARTSACTRNPAIGAVTTRWTLPSTVVVAVIL
tara:strand:- start:35252 stop:35563 length:312 start_codon:yes stop_codon:yes gene_type:complete